MFVLTTIIFTLNSEFMTFYELVQQIDYSMLTHIYFLGKRYEAITYINKSEGPPRVLHKIAPAFVDYATTCLRRKTTFTESFS